MTFYFRKKFVFLNRPFLYYLVYLYNLNRPDLICLLILAKKWNMQKKLIHHNQNTLFGNNTKINEAYPPATNV